MIGEDNGLSPREHGEMRDKLLIGARSIRPAGSGRSQFAAAGVALILVGAVAGGIAGFALNGDRSTGMPAATPSATATAGSTVPQQCLDYELRPGANSPGGDAIAATAATAALPDGVVISPGVDVTESATVSGTLDATVRVCGDQVTRATLVEVGNAIARTVSASDADHSSLSGIIVEAWGPIDSDAIAERADISSIRTDFQTHDWATADPDAPWK